METECRQGEISQELARLHEKNECLHDRIGILCDRLKDLLSKPKEKEDAKPDQCCPPKQLLKSQLAIDLSSVSITIEADVDKIDDIINRLEL